MPEHYRARLSATPDGVRFRDLNRNGVMDPYEGALTAEAPPVGKLPIPLPSSMDSVRACTADAGLVAEDLLYALGSGPDITPLTKDDNPSDD